MSDEEIILIYNEMVEIYGSLPSWKHEPQQFEYLVKLFLYRKHRNQITEV